MGIQTMEFSDKHFKIIIMSILKWIKDKKENFHKELKFLNVEIVRVLKYNQPKNTLEKLMNYIQLKKELEDLRSEENIHTEIQRRKWRKKDRSR